jgi:hypothetical protein
MDKEAETELQGHTHGKSSNVIYLKSCEELLSILSSYAAHELGWHPAKSQENRSKRHRALYISPQAFTSIITASFGAIRAMRTLWGRSFLARSFRVIYGYDIESTHCHLNPEASYLGQQQSSQDTSRDRDSAVRVEGNDYDCRLRCG